MVNVTAVCYVKEENLAEFLSIAKELVEKTNTLDKGCVRYMMYKDTSDPLHFVMLEEWESQEALDVHMEAQHFVELVPKLGEQTSKPIELTIMEDAF